MGVVSSNQKTATVLRRMLDELETDATIDTQDPAFVALKCTLLNRILELETGKARVEAVIHLVEPQDDAGSQIAVETEEGENAKDESDESASA